jgi:hypothetical protein
VVDAAGVDFPDPPQPITGIHAMSNKLQMPNLIPLLISLIPFPNKVGFRRWSQRALSLASHSAQRSLKDPYCTVTLTCVVA